MSILTHIPSSTRTFPKIRARYAAVMILSWVTPACIFARVNKRALGPIMRISP
ncbi:hypothetical protein HanIR_Chr01g0028241 [Helianthus annuus]|nr:hypothetical protein HanIR_Chr01g0028241 [Helianthus annuus]